MTARPYRVGSDILKTQAELDQRIKQALNSHPVNEVFRDDLLAAVVNSLHRAVRQASQQVLMFQYLDWHEQLRRGLDTADRYRGGKLVLGWFSPLHAWRDVTVYPHRKTSRPEVEVKQALREKIGRVIPWPAESDVCARQPCTGSGFDLEYNHVEPTFNAMAEACLRLMSEEEIVTEFGYSKFVRGQDELAHLIPDDHPAFVRLLELHQDNQWEWLCAFHHRGVQQ